MPNLRPLDLRLLRGLVRPIDVLAAMAWTPTTRERASIRGPCPIHGSRSRFSRSLSVADRWWRCHSCGAHGDALELYRLIHRKPVLEAAYELCDLLAIDPPYL
ncbi:MAG: CHC2 zinc finger domain-containing protein [Pseudonocardiaceae bacterium]